MSGEKTLAVLIAARVDDVLVLRRLLRESSYRVDGVTGATQALRAITQHSYSAVVADQEEITGLSGAKLLSHVEELQPGALRLLIASREQRPALANQSLSGRFQLFVRPYFAAPVRDALVAHERAASSRPRAGGQKSEIGREIVRRAEAAERPRRAERKPETRLRKPPSAAALLEESTVSFGDAALNEADTKPYALVSGGAVARRRLLSTMAELAEATLGHASGHAARVALLAVALGRAIGLGAAELDALDEAALLHDVGELAAGVELWRAPRRLNQAELAAVHRHAIASHGVAQRCGAAKPALAAVRHHHERWDGRGYPDGLARAAIPVTARVLAVADTWDALATARPYRGKQSAGECARTLRAAGGLQLDPALVELFLSRRLHEAIDWANPPRAAELLPAAPSKPAPRARARHG